MKRAFDWPKEGRKTGKSFRCDSSPIGGILVADGQIHNSHEGMVHAAQVDRASENLKRASRKINEARPTAADAASRLKATLGQAPELSSDRFNGAHVIELERRLAGVTRIIKNGELGDTHSVDASFPDYTISVILTVFVSPDNSGLMPVCDSRRAFNLSIYGGDIRVSTIGQCLNKLREIDKAHTAKLKAKSLKSRPILIKAADFFKSIFNGWRE